MDLRIDQLCLRFRASNRAASKGADSLWQICPKSVPNMSKNAAKKSQNVAELDMRRLLIIASIGGVVGTLIGVLVSRSLLGAIVLGVLGFFVTLAVAWKAIQAEATARGLKLRIGTAKKK